MDWWQRFCLALGLAASPPLPSSGAEAVYLEAIQAPDLTPAHRASTLVVEGQLPSPAYELLPPVVQVKAPLVVVHLGSRLAHRGPSIQVLHPFRQVIDLPPLPPGLYELRVQPPQGEAMTRSLRVAGGS